MNAITISLPSSHASLVSHPNEIAQLILNATRVAKKQTHVINQFGTSAPVIRLSKKNFYPFSNLSIFSTG
jgi:hypothetical protein